MANVEFGTGKTVVILSIVVACFAMLWPRILYPMVMSFSSKRADVDDGDGCCDVIFETDINAIKIMTEMCGTILNRQEDFNPKLFQAFQQGKLSKEVINTCRSEVMKMCGIDIAEFLSKKEKLGHSYKQMLDEIRSFNISVCLRHHFGINPGLLGGPRRMRIWGPSTSRHLRQERPLHFHPEIIHPALREKGRAIPQSQSAKMEKESSGRPIPVPGMRPPMGGAGHVVPPPKTGGTMSIVMPLYTIGIVIFFVYTVMKVFMKKTTENEAYKDFQSDPEFRRTVFSEDYSNGSAARIKEDELRLSGKHSSKPRRSLSKELPTTRLGMKERDTRDLEIDDLKKRLEVTEKAMERIVAQMERVPTQFFNSPQIKKFLEVTTAITGLLAEFDQHLNKGREAQTQYKTELKDKKILEEFCEEEKPVKESETSEKVDITNKESLWLRNGRAGDHGDLLENSEDDKSKPKIKVVGLEMMAECEGGQKWSGPAIPNLGVGGSSRSATPIPPPHTPEPQNIFLEGSLPQQSQLLVTDSKTQALTLKDMGEPEPPVILSSKMTLSLISLDATAPEGSHHHDHTLSQTENQVDVKSDDDNFGNIDSTLLDVDSDLIDETGHIEPDSSDVHDQGVESENVSKQVNEVAEENPSGNYTAPTLSEEAEAGMVTGLEDTAADVSNLDGLDLVEDQEDLQHEDAELWNGSEKDEEESQDEDENEAQHD